MHKNKKKSLKIHPVINHSTGILIVPLVIGVSVITAAALYASNTPATPTSSARSSSTLAPAKTPAQLGNKKQKEKAKAEKKKQEIASSSTQSSGAAPSSSVTYPSNILNLTNWKVTLPTNTDLPGNPDEVKQPSLATFSVSPYFMVRGSGVAFRAPVGGSTTVNSTYPRSELRERTNGRDASWSNASGTHTMSVTQSVVNTPAVKPHVVTAQIHDGSDDVVMIRLEGKQLFVERDGKSVGMLNANYSLGTVYTVKIVAAQSKINVYYNGSLKVTLPISGSGWYFKTGCYTQSNTSKGDAAGAYGEVHIYGLSVSHT